MVTPSPRLARGRLVWRGAIGATAPPSPCVMHASLTVYGPRLTSGRPAQRVVGPVPRRLFRLIGKLLPTNGGFHHHPPDGLYDHGHTVDEVGGRGDTRLQHHGRGPCREAELARLTMALMTRACGPGDGQRLLPPPRTHKPDRRDTIVLHAVVFHVQVDPRSQLDFSALKLLLT